MDEDSATAALEKLAGICDLADINGIDNEDYIVGDEEFFDEAVEAVMEAKPLLLREFYVDGGTGGMPVDCLLASVDAIKIIGYEIDSFGDIFQQPRCNGASGTLLGITEEGTWVTIGVKSMTFPEMGFTVTIVEAPVELADGISLEEITWKADALEDWLEDF